MTKEEIIKGLQAVNEHIGKHFNEGGAWMAEFIDNAIQTLEQQPCEDWKFYYNHGYAQARNDVLDKIRAEVEALSNANPSYTHTCDVVDRDDVLDIIDKYKAESEE